MGVVWPKMRVMANICYSVFILDFCTGGIDFDNFVRSTVPCF